RPRRRATAPHVGWHARGRVGVLHLGGMGESRRRRRHHGDTRRAAGDRRVLRAYTMNPNPVFYDWVARYYDVVYAQIDFEAITAQWQQLLTDLGLIRRGEAHDQRTLLDVGCGLGDALVAWGRAGFAVYGLDSSRTMIDTATERAQKCLSRQHTVGFFH